MPSRKRPAQNVVLDEYHDKRRASATPEPFGSQHKPTASGKARALGGLFVVQQHRARHLHFDFRLEMDGVLRSWAVPKGPSADPIDKRFAALVEDHPIEYGDFEGRIPSGNYGAGYVIVWDRGTWAPRNDFAEGWRKGKLLFDLSGHKLRGRWTLVRIKSKENKAENDWLLIKERDEYVVKDAAFPDDSVLSGLTLDEMPEPAARQERLARDLKRVKVPAAPARRAAPQPMLASSGEPFDRAGWLFEFKYDGYRLFADKNAQNVTLLSRNGLSLTDRFPEIAKAVSMLPFDQLLIDGELVVLDRSGRPSFSDLQTRVAVTDRASIAVASRHQPATFFAFDLVEALGRNLRELPLLERKKLLVQMLPTVGPVRYSIHIEDQGRATFTAAQQLGLEGIVGKRAASRYQSGRSPDWIKVRTRKTGDFVVVGWTPGRSDATDLGALVLAEYRSGNLTLVGRVGSGLTSSQRKELKPKLIPQPTPSAIGDSDASVVHWVKPELVCEAAFREYTTAGHLRQPVFVRIRTDKTPAECIGHFDVPVAAPPADTSDRTIEITNADKIFFPEKDLTKGDLVDYYKNIAPWMLPYLEDRPLVLTRFPDGIHGKSFYQRDAPEFVPDWIRRETLWSEGAERDVHYFIVEDTASLCYLANLGTIPIHTWHSCMSDLTHPDWCVLDLDPKDAPFSSVIAVARAIRNLVSELELPAYLKTSGASGLHVLIPLARQLTHEQARTFTELLARVIVEREPKIATITRIVRKREKKVYIDYLQNGHGRLLVAPFSARAEPSAGVSMPLRWEELTNRLSNENYHIRNAVKRMRTLGEDPWAGFLGERVDLARVLHALTQIAH
jgi:bifunctional non-homologous end joining protein LigD